MSGPVRLRAGAALADVTPDGPVRLAGHAFRSTDSEGVASPLGVRVLVLDDGRNRVLLASADALWWPPEHITRLRARTAAALDLPADAVLLTATHTHSAPQPSAAFAPSLGRPDPDFPHRLESGLIAAGRIAVDRLARCRLIAAQARERIGVHRRLVVDERTVMAPNRSVPVDDRVRVVQLVADQGTVATVVHLACHPTTTGDNLVSADHPGALARWLDRDQGGTTLVLQGCAGDVRPDLTDGDGHFRLGTEADAVALGERVARASVEALRTGGEELVPTALRAVSSRIPLTLESGTEVPLTMSRARLAADWEIIGLGCEPVGRYQQAAPQAWVTGYTNGMIGYLPTADQLRDGGYEPCGSLPHFRLDSAFRPDTEARVVAAIGAEPATTPR